MPHIHEKIDFCSEVFVVYKDKVLIRKHDKAGAWIGVGGHVELDEDPNTTAIREVKEEVGLDIVLLSPRSLPKDEDLYKQLIPPWYVRHNSISNSTHIHIDLIYFATSNSDAVVPEKPTDEWKWFSFEDLEKNEVGMSEHVLFYAREALTLLGK